LTHLLEACDTINPLDVSESNQRLMQFGYSLTCQAKERLKTLSSVPLPLGTSLRDGFLIAYFQKQNTWIKIKRSQALVKRTVNLSMTHGIGQTTS